MTDSEREALTSRVRVLEGSRMMLIDTIGGTVEGRPTHGLNYLQRVRELMQAEAERDAARTHAGELRTLIADDAYAMTFQTLGQYRSALLKALASGESK